MGGSIGFVGWTSRALSSSEELRSPLPRRRRSLAPWAALLIVLGLSACSKPEADKRLLYGSSKDLDDFFRRARTTTTFADCENIRMNAQVTRGLSCTTKLNDEEMRGLIARFEIARDQPDPGSGTAGRCESRAAFALQQNAHVEVWRTKWTCAAKDQPFTYLEIRRREDGASCVEVLPQACD